METTSSTPYDEQIKILDAQIAEAEKAIEPLRRKRDDLLQKKAELLCPFKVGDIVVRDTTRRLPIMHFPHKEHHKEIPVKIRARVTEILSSRLNGYNARGIRLCKDGSDGVKIGLYIFDHWYKEAH